MWKVHLWLRYDERIGTAHLFDLATPRSTPRMQMEHLRDAVSHTLALEEQSRRCANCLCQSRASSRRRYSQIVAGS